MRLKLTTASPSNSLDSLKGALRMASDLIAGILMESNLLDSTKMIRRTDMEFSHVQVLNIRGNIRMACLKDMDYSLNRNLIINAVICMKVSF